MKKRRFARGKAAIVGATFGITVLGATPAMAGFWKSVEYGLQMSVVCFALVVPITQISCAVGTGVAVGFKYHEA